MRNQHPEEADKHPNCWADKYIQQPPWRHTLASESPPCPALHRTVPQLLPASHTCLCKARSTSEQVKWPCSPSHSCLCTKLRSGCINDCGSR